jgi:tetratricopeptide (TPR) repeat protein
MADHSEPDELQGIVANAKVEPARVFVSYASPDAAVAGALVESLERHGIACWIAPRDVKAGALYADAIVRAISGAKALVLVLSEDAIGSSHVGKEVERASSKKRPIISKENSLARMAAFAKAIRLDPKFAKAYVGAAEAQIGYSGNYAPGPEVPAWNQRARENAEKAIALAPELGEAHAAMGLASERGYLELARAETEYERALTLAPNDSGVLIRC